MFKLPSKVKISQVKSNLNSDKFVQSGHTVRNQLFLGRFYLDPKDEDEDIIRDYFFNSTEGETKPFELTSIGRFLSFIYTRD